MKQLYPQIYYSQYYMSAKASISNGGRTALQQLNALEITLQPVLTPLRYRSVDCYAPTASETNFPSRTLLTRRKALGQLGEVIHIVSRDSDKDLFNGCAASPPLPAHTPGVGRALSPPSCRAARRRAACGAADRYPFNVPALGLWAVTLWGFSSAAFRDDAVPYAPGQPPLPQHPCRVHSHGARPPPPPPLPPTPTAGGCRP